MRLLILGGTAQARELAGAVAGRAGLETVLSLAGRTAQPLEQGVPVRRGGFGGVEGLVRYLCETGTDLVVDATHPYAAQMSRHAAAAAVRTGVPLLHLCRPPWEPEAPETWIRVPDLAAAVAALPAGARAFTATGRGSLEIFAGREDVWTCLRVIDAPDRAFPGNGEFVVARPPFSVEAEVGVLRRHRATHLVVKNAGGGPARTKLTAAARLGLPILIVDRTPLPAGHPVVETVGEALDWLDARL
jgi:precorrin-6A/cobalt-precorrin-6A reductase